jgi:HSP20 family molecular chaperone IbpA
LEIEQGHFSRRLRLPDDADESSVAARHREGLLLISMPKRAAAPEKARRAPQENQP